MKWILSLLTLLSLGWMPAPAADWSNWRGPEHDGVSRDTGLPSTFDVAAGTNVIWQTPIGGRTTPIVQKGHVYLINAAGSGTAQQERVACFDEATGKELWEHRFNVWHTDIVTDRLGWTTMVGDPETDTVFAHGTQGLLFCFDHSGKILWQHSLTEEYGRITGYGGRTTSPIVDGDLLIMGMLNANWGDQAIGETRFVAFDKRTGKVVWWSKTGFRPKNTYYSIPVVADINGERLLISGGGDGGVHAFKVRTGEKVWSYIFGTADINCSPVVSGDFVYIAHGDNNNDSAQQGRVICLDASKVKDGKPELVWKVDGIKVKYASPTLADGRLYVSNDLAVLFCLDAKTGKRYWRFPYGKNAKGSGVMADGKLYIGDVDGNFHILQPGEKSCKRLHSEFFPNESEINGSPAIVNGRVYFMTNHALFCIGLKTPGEAGKIPAPPPEAAAGTTVAHVQIFPADVVVYPGQSVELKAIGYDAGGRKIGPVKVDWSLAGPRLPDFLPPPPSGTPPPPAVKGKLSATMGSDSTTFTAQDAPPPGQFGRVLATLPGMKLSGETRVRIAIKLPYKADFSKIPLGRTPGGWINTQGKFGAVKLDDGTFALKKLAVIPSPLVARANAYIGLPNLSNYTVQADVMGNQVGGDLPDFGVGANRYNLQMSGNSKNLRLVSWDAVPRIDRVIHWEMKPNVWYRMKITAEVKDGKAHVRGKVWDPTKEEPTAWTLELTDSTPNTEGSPSLFANATGIDPPKIGTEIFFKNVSVTPNK